MIIATAGHIDHGKTSLVKALTGIDTDRLPEEKARGMTIDLGFARFALPDGSAATFVDVPGHERFIRTMIAGVGGVGCALIVVAADDGIMAQTVEHLEILDLLAVTRGCVALTKTDRVDEDRVAAVAREIENRLATTSLRGLPVIPVSSVTGAGIDTLRSALQSAIAPAQSAAGEGRFRMTVDRAFSLRGAGLVATGVVWSGSISAGDHALLSPTGRELRIRGIHSNGAEIGAARAGTRCALNIAGAGLEKDEFRRGTWIIDPALHAPTAIMDVEIALTAAGRGKPAAREQGVHVYLGTEHVTATLRQIGSEHSDFRRLVLDRPIAALHGDRFVLRDAADMVTLAGGRVIDPFAPQRRWSNAARVHALEATRYDDPARALRALSAQGPVLLRRYLLSRNVTPEEGARILAAVPLDIRGRGEHEIGFALELWKHLRDSVIACVTEHGASDAAAAGTPLAEIQRAIKPNDQPEIVDHVLASLVADGTIIRIGRQVRLASARPALGAGEMRRWRQLRGALEAAGLRPPPLVELAALTDWDAAAIERLLARAEQSGLAMRVAPNRYFLPETLRALGEIAARLADESQDGSFTASTFKDRSGIGRNISIDLLEFFDHVRLTQRIGSRRRMRSEVAAVFPDSPLECA